MLFTTDVDFFSSAPMKFHSGITVWASSMTIQTRFPRLFSSRAILNTPLKNHFVYSRMPVVLEMSGRSKSVNGESEARKSLTHVENLSCKIADWAFINSLFCLFANSSSSVVSFSRASLISNLVCSGTILPGLRSGNLPRHLLVKSTQITFVPVAAIFLIRSRQKTDLAHLRLK